MSKASVYVTERSPGKFSIRTYLGVKADGTPRFKYETHSGDKESANIRAKEIEIASLRGEAPEDTGTSVGAFLDDFLERADRRKSLALSTRRGYRQCKNRVPERLARRKLDKVRGKDFEALYDDLLESGLSLTTVGNTHRFLHLAFESTVGEEIARNPLEKVRAPKEDKKADREFDLYEDFDLEEEAEGKIATIPRDNVFELIESFERPTGLMQRNPMLHALFFLAYSTGLRRGELLALTWKAIDLDAGKLHVRRAIYWPSGVAKPVVKEPKTKSGVRTIAISPHTVVKLKQWRARLEEIAKEAHMKTPPLVFVDLRTLGPYKPDTASNAFRTRMKWLGLKGSMHMLRHTHASELLAAKAPIPVVSRRLGHANVAITLRIYAHAIPGSDETVASEIDEILGLGKGRK